ncbi:MAG: phosphotransferase family protein [Chloroflexota bacterium]
MTLEPASKPPTLQDDALRRAPSREALARLCAEIQPGSTVRRVQRLRGGVSSGMHAVLLAGPGDTRQWVVVRRYGAWRITHYPRTPEQEWATLTALARVGAPTPLPLWLDREGAVFGCPTLVTSRVPGRGLLAPRDEAGWIKQLAEALGKIHAAPLTQDELAILVDQQGGLVRLLDRDTPPTTLTEHAGGSEIWHAMRRLWPTIQPGAPTIVHGDYWPGNTLWHRGRLSGVIDWEQVRRGNPALDVACCRQDLAVLIGPAAAEAFLHAYQACTGRTIQHLAFWDLYMCSWSIGQLETWVKGYHDLGRTDLSFTEAGLRRERFVADALARAVSASAG